MWFADDGRQQVFFNRFVFENCWAEKSISNFRIPGIPGTGEYIPSVYQANEILILDSSPVPETTPQPRNRNHLQGHTEAIILVGFQSGKIWV